MSLHRTVPALVLGLFACTASAQGPAGMRWPGTYGSLGLQAGKATFHVPVAEDIGVYGRFGTISRPQSPMRFGGSDGTGLTYGLGVVWDFSPRASATLSWDSHDLRGAWGERDVRATSLGLQWRY
ncbi:MAG: hypothetical protein ACO1PB_15715 [Ramlibacter sp.]